MLQFTELLRPLETGIAASLTKTKNQKATVFALRQLRGDSVVLLRELPEKPEQAGNLSVARDITVELVGAGYRLVQVRVQGTEALLFEARELLAARRRYLGRLE